MKQYMTLLCLLFCLLCLTACGECEHQWQPASCEAAKSCTLCDATEGDALGHQWQDADCEAPKSCIVCKKTEGVPLGHSWQDASCEAPKTCTTCKVTEGEAKGHSLREANFQDPASCRNCDYTEGEPVPPAYDAYPVEVITVEIGKTYDYKAACYVKGHTTIGKLTWENYQVFASDAAHEAVEGYEWHSVTVKIVFSDSNARKYGFHVQSAVDDYYWVLSKDGNGYTDRFTISYHGEEYDQCLMANGYGQVTDWIDNACTYTATFAWRVPVGYDGFLALFYDANQSAGELLENGDEHMLVFRFAA